MHSSRNRGAARPRYLSLTLTAGALGLLFATTSAHSQAQQQPSIDDVVTSINGVITNLGMGPAFHQWNTERGVLESRLGELGQRTAETGVWVRGLGAKQSIGHGVPAVRQDLGGIRLGWDQTIAAQDGRWIWGVLAGYSRANRNLGLGNKATADSYSAGLYGGYLADNGAFGTAALTYNRLGNKVKLNSDFLGANTSYDNNAAGLALDAGRRFGFEQGWFLEPRAGLDFFYLGKTQRERGNNMWVTATDGSVTQARAALKLGREVELSNGTITPYVRVGVAKAWAHSSKDDFQTVSKYGVGGARMEVGGGVAANLGKSHSLFADYTYSSGKGFKQPVAVLAGYRYQW
ncbi:autotransporter outer membrane beta-barrel domain-containing protein [Bordetella sp. LUAb4]|uniref:autotransporter outer membrane beta-barrel domain-containing protein n=1 Tax=Bordetella sp. LUAb4 TaxID=2843195 RepID=UPI001E3089F7|nr:autotransporter outer membrane beta-barrel domain-containing protein [Bordetella sp. LUAb4]